MDFLLFSLIPEGHFTRWGKQNFVKEQVVTVWCFTLWFFSIFSFPSILGLFPQPRGWFIRSWIELRSLLSKNFLILLTPILDYSINY